jgi:hypothetical protein
MHGVSIESTPGSMYSHGLQNINSHGLQNITRTATAQAPKKSLQVKRAASFSGISTIVSPLRRVLANAGNEFHPTMFKRRAVMQALTSGAYLHHHALRVVRESP